MRTDKKLWRNRKARKELARRLQSENPGLEVVHPVLLSSKGASKCPGRLGLTCLLGFRFDLAPPNPPALPYYIAFLSGPNADCIFV